MEQRIINRLHIRNVFAGMGALLLCVLAIYASGNWKNLILGFLALGGFFCSSLLIKKSVDAGEIISVYAHCYEVIDECWSKRKKRRVTFRFIVAEEDSDEDDDGVSIFISAPYHKFREGSDYCLLFRKRKDGKCNESNLVGSMEMPPDIVSFTTKTECPDEDFTEVDAADESFEDPLLANWDTDEVVDIPQKNNIIYFNKR